MSGGASKPERITFGKFQNVDLRVALVVAVDEVAGAVPPCRVLDLDLGPLGRRRSVGQFALVPVDRLLGHKVVTCVNLSPREVAGVLSEVLVLGTDHPDSPADQRQSAPLYADASAPPGGEVF